MIFFKQEEVQHFKDVAGKSYRTTNPEDQKYRNLLKPNVEKLKYWASKCPFDDFIPKVNGSWQWSGTFKSYLWIRFYRPTDSTKVYFVFGIHENGELYLALNCQRSNHSAGSTVPLTPKQIASFDDYLLRSSYEEEFVKFTDLETYTWDDLIEKSINFFYKYAALYDELEALINEDIFVEEDTKKYTLLPSQMPDETKSYVNGNRSFEGKITDWSKKQLVSSRLGQLGEELVLKVEKSKVKELGFIDKVERVMKKLDGEGYDILSFDEDGEEMYIEVKTTKGNSNEPFYLSANEKAFCEAHPSKYVIYRLHNYIFQTCSAQIYKIKGSEILGLQFSPINFEVSIKNKKQI